jgi:hypothetical protein
LICSSSWMNINSRTDMKLLKTLAKSIWLRYTKFDVQAFSFQEASPFTKQSNDEHSKVPIHFRNKKKGTWSRLEKTCLLSNVQTETLRPMIWNDTDYLLPKIALKPLPALQGSTDKHDSRYHLSIPKKNTPPNDLPTNDF